MDPYKFLQTHRGKGKSRKWITGKKRDERNIFFFFLYVKEVGTMTTYSTFATSYSITIQPDHRPSPIRPEHSKRLFGPHKNELVQYGSSIQKTSIHKNLVRHGTKLVQLGKTILLNIQSNFFPKFSFHYLILFECKHIIFNVFSQQKFY